MAVVLSTGCARGENLPPPPTQFHYVSYDGKRSIVIDQRESRVATISGNEARWRNLELSGGLQNCSTTEIRCVGFESLWMAVPRGSPMPRGWRIDDYAFSIVGQLREEGQERWLVECAKGTDVYAHFSYSKARGIETISTQDEGNLPGVAVTYFLNGTVGLLAKE